jgi:acyl-CoA thioester hydrolase
MIYPAGMAEAFEIVLGVRPEDIDELGHVNNVTYLRWVQDVAVAHWREAAAPEDQAEVVWVVVRHEIDYKRPALPEDEIIARTWVGDASRVTFERHTELLRARDRVLLAKARTLWCPLDPRSMRPVAVSDSIRGAFSARPA